MGCAGQASSATTASTVVLQQPVLEQAGQQGSQQAITQQNQSSKVHIQVDDMHGGDRKTTEHSMTLRQEFTLNARSQADYKQPKFFGDNQFLICSPTGANIKITASGDKIGLVVLGPSEFPLRKYTEVWEDTGVKQKQVSINVVCRTVEGFVVFVIGEGQAKIELDGCGKPILSILHVEPLP